MKCLQILKERNHASINHLFEASLVPPPLLQSIDLSLYTSVKSESRKTGGVQSRHCFINEAQSRVESVVFVHGVAVSSQLLNAILVKSIVHTCFLFFISYKLTPVSVSLKIHLVRLDHHFSHHPWSIKHWYPRQ